MNALLATIPCLQNSPKKPGNLRCRALQKRNHQTQIDSTPLRVIPLNGLKCFAAAAILQYKQLCE